MEPEKLVLPADIQDKQICSKCLNYLSFGPVVLTEEGKAICGRCNDGTTYNVKSLYNKIAQFFLFKCVNHYSGCNQLLEFDNAETHETHSCPDQHLQNCFICLKYYSNVVQLIQHFIKNHPKTVIKNDVFKITLVECFERTLIFCKYDQILKVRATIKNNTLYIYITSGNPNYLVYTDCEVSLFTPNYQPEYRSGLVQINSIEVHTNPCILLNLDDIAKIFPSRRWILCRLILAPKYKLEGELFKLKREHMLQIQLKEHLLNVKLREYQDKHKQLIDNLQKHVQLTGTSIISQFQEDQQKNLRTAYSKKSNEPEECSLDQSLELLGQICTICIQCVSCRSSLEILSSPTLFQCTKGHLSCSNCSKFVCQICGSNIIRRNLKRIKLKCSWNNCNELKNNEEYLYHQQTCHFRQFKCPSIECDFVGKRPDFINHWHNSIPLKLENTVQFSLLQPQNFYWISDFELLKFDCSLTTSQTCNSYRSNKLGSSNASKYKLRILIDTALFSHNYILRLWYKKKGESGLNSRDGWIQSLNEKYLEIDDIYAWDNNVTLEIIHNYVVCSSAKRAD